MKTLTNFPLNAYPPYKRYIRYIGGLILCLFSLQAFAVHHIDTDNPYSVVKEATNTTFNRFVTDKTKIEKDKDYLKEIVEEDLMPYIDYKYAALKVMGRYVRTATTEQRQAFVDAFYGYLVTTYAQTFTAYTNQKVEFSSEEDFKGEKQVTVNIKVVDAGRPPIDVGFKMRRLKDGSWKAYDLIAEGVSLIRSKQAEIGNLIRKEGIDDVIKMLSERASGTLNDRAS